MQTTILRKSASQLKTLGHTKRLEITYLLQGHELTVGQIAQMTALRQASVSQHLAQLKANRLVQTQKIGKEIYYSLNSSTLDALFAITKDLTRKSPLNNAEPTVIDPVCHMHLTPSAASYTTEYDGIRHYFCGKGCLKDFSVLHKGTL